VGFEPTIAVLERAKTVRAPDRSATAIGYKFRMKARRGNLTNNHQRLFMKNDVFWDVALYWRSKNRL
jgi:hypothetical protein